MNHLQKYELAKQASRGDILRKILGRTVRNRPPEIADSMMIPSLARYNSIPLRGSTEADKWAKLLMKVRRHVLHSKNKQSEHLRILASGRLGNPVWSRQRGTGYDV